MLKCALCGRPLKETASWKGRGESFYCSEFCADAEPIDVAAFLPQAGALTLARTSRRVAGAGFRSRLAV